MSENKKDVIVSFRLSSDVYKKLKCILGKKSSGDKKNISTLLRNMIIHSINHWK